MPAASDVADLKGVVASVQGDMTQVIAKLTGLQTQAANGLDAAGLADLEGSIATLRGMHDAALAVLAAPSTANPPAGPGTQEGPAPQSAAPLGPSMARS